MLLMGTIVAGCAGVRRKHCYSGTSDPRVAARYFLGGRTDISWNHVTYVGDQRYQVTGWLPSHDETGGKVTKKFECIMSRSPDGYTWCLKYLEVWIPSGTLAGEGVVEAATDRPLGSSI